MAYVNTIFNDNFLEYASYVIKDRAIPHIDDGLKPVQRRILHSLLEVDDGKFHKVANIVGHCMKYHPHGDQSIYSALVVLANKELFIDKQGNFGNVLTGDEASAARYIECRVNDLAKELLYRPEITEYLDSYDGRNKEPVVFPAKAPLVLVLGAEGIAVGMSTKILPHNFVEVMEAVKARLRGERSALYPDFPGGGLLDASEYDDGQGKVLVRAKLDTSDPKRIVIREIPFGTTTESLIASIEGAAKKGRIKIQSIDDYTSEEVEIEIKLARGVYAQEVIDALYAYTDCEMSLSVNLLVIKENNPVPMTITEVLDYHAEKLLEILEKELELERGKLLDKLHQRTLERIFIEERIYKRIEEMETQEKVVQAVYDGLEPYKKEIRRKVTDEDIERLLRIPIRRISLYDINKAKKEMEEIKERLEEIKNHLANLTDYAVAYIEGVVEKYGASYTRRTEVTSFSKVDVKDLVERDRTLRWNASGSYLGYSLTDGKELFSVSPFDRVLIIRGDGSYTVTDAPEKLFVREGVLSCGLAEKDVLATKVFTVVYKGRDGIHYIKRCKIEQYILEKEYRLVPEGAKPVLLTTRDDAVIHVEYVKKPRMQKLEDDFPVDDYLVKSARAGGVRLTAKEVKKTKLVIPKKNNNRGQRTS
ncbi:MAG: DNA topoisomerase IV subunit A [Spirochaetaceae bacterium]